MASERVDPHERGQRWDEFAALDLGKKSGGKPCVISQFD
jgi:hypothetical protein